MNDGCSTVRLLEWISDLDEVGDEDLQSLANALGLRIHVAIVSPEYLPLIEDGVKVVESRLSKHRIVPFEAVEAGDIILLKQTSGSIQLIAVAGFTQYTGAGAERDVSSVLAPHMDALAYQPGFLDSKQDARYVSLIGLEDVQRVPDTRMRRRRRSGWDVFTPSAPSLL